MAASSLSAQALDDETLACLDCHAATTQDSDGIRSEEFAASVHAALGCTACHATGYEDLPHTAEQKADDCTACHTDSDPPYHFAWIINDVRASVHGRMVSQEFACIECHNPHEILPVQRAPDMRKAIAKVNYSCLECHGQENDDATPQESRHSLAQLSNTHLFLPQLKRHADAARCVECHTPGREQTVHLILSAKSAVRDCVECHTRDSAMREKFYRHMAEQERQRGLVDSIILNNYYMVGVTRNQRMEYVLWGLFCVSFVGICTHGAIRLATRGKRS
jgi:hypothetical protein